jgi:hypothetical protein
MCLQKLKGVMTISSMLATPDFFRPFVLKEQAKSTYDKEMLPIINALSNGNNTYLVLDSLSRLITTVRNTF